MTKTVNGQPISKVSAGHYEVTIGLKTYALTGVGREWHINVKYGQFFNLQPGQFSSMGAAARELALRTFEVTR